MAFSKGYIFESLQDSKRKDKHGRGQGHKKKEVDPLQSDMPLGKKCGFCNTIFSEGIKEAIVPWFYLYSSSVHVFKNTLTDEMLLTIGPQDMISTLGKRLICIRRIHRKTI